jgi:hypothetical protein
VLLEPVALAVARNAQEGKETTIFGRNFTFFQGETVDVRFGDTPAVTVPSGEKLKSTSIDVTVPSLSISGSAFVSITVITAHGSSQITARILAA